MKKAIVYQIRYTDRPDFPQLRKSLTRSPWEEAPVDFALAAHGPYIPLPETRHPVVDLRGKTDGSIGDIIRRLFVRAMHAGYKYVGFLDDDGYFTRVKESTTYLLNAMESSPKLGAVGCLYGMMRVYERKRGADLQPFGTLLKYKGIPWTGLGFQMYRVKALQSIDLSKCSRVTTCNDVYTWMSLHVAGWEHGLVAVRFDHTCSGYLASRKAVGKSPERATIGERDVRVLMDDFGHHGLGKDVVDLGCRLIRNLGASKEHVQSVRKELEEKINEQD